MDGVGDAQTFHSVGMPPLLEMHFKGPSAPIAIIATNLTLILNPQAMELIQPIGYRLLIPPQRQILRIINRLIRIHLALRFSLIIGFILLLISARLFLPDQVHSIVEDPSELVSVPCDEIFQSGHLFHFVFVVYFELLFGFLLLLEVVLVHDHSVQAGLLQHFGALFGGFEVLLAVEVVDVGLFTQKQFLTVGTVHSLIIRKLMLLPPRNDPLLILVLKVGIILLYQLANIHQGPDLPQEPIQILNHMLQIPLKFRRIPHLDWDRDRLELVEVLQIPEVVSELVLLLHVEGFERVQVLQVEGVHVDVLAFRLLGAEDRLFLGRAEYDFVEVFDGVGGQVYDRGELLMEILEFLGPLIEVKPYTGRPTLVSGIDIPEPTDDLHLLLPLGVLISELPQSFLGALLDHLHKDANFGVDQDAVLGVFHLQEHQFDDDALQGFDAL